ncbi:hypothetical protein LLS1_28640 [Leifsonia sp. LS1]|nr:hypothetical protein LLS1_28640 [Leifsonia sp. LS1]
MSLSDHLRQMRSRQAESRSGEGREFVEGPLGEVLVECCSHAPGGAPERGAAAVGGDEDVAAVGVGVRRRD